MKKECIIILFCLLLNCVEKPLTNTFQGECIDGVPEGSFKLARGNGTLMNAGHFINGRLDGPLVDSDSSGDTVALVNYKEGIVHGTVTVWHPSAGKDDSEKRVKLTSTYVDGKLHGEKKHWYADGKKRCLYVYVMGKLTSAVVWNKNGDSFKLSYARSCAESDEIHDYCYYKQIEQVIQDNIPCPKPTKGNGPVIEAGTGWGDVCLCADREKIESVLGEGEYAGDSETRINLHYPSKGIKIVWSKSNYKVWAIYFYNKDVNYKGFTPFNGKTAKGIDWDASVADVKKAYGEPLRDYGPEGGGKWRSLVYHDIDFRFLNKKLVRIGVPGK